MCIEIFILLLAAIVTYELASTADFSKANPSQALGVAVIFTQSDMAALVSFGGLDIPISIRTNTGPISGGNTTLTDNGLIMLALHFTQILRALVHFPTRFAAQNLAYHPSSCHCPQSSRSISHDHFKRANLPRCRC